LREKRKQAYVSHQDKPRYMTQMSDRDVVVIPSASLPENLKGVEEKTMGKA